MPLIFDLAGEFQLSATGQAAINGILLLSAGRRSGRRGWAYVIGNAIVVVVAVIIRLPCRKYSFDWRLMTLVCGCTNMRQTSRSFDDNIGH